MTTKTTRSSQPQYFSRRVAIGEGLKIFAAAGGRDPFYARVCRIHQRGNDLKVWLDTCWRFGDQLRRELLVVEKGKQINWRAGITGDVIARFEDSATLDIVESSVSLTFAMLKGQSFSLFTDYFDMEQPETFGVERIAWKGEVLKTERSIYRDTGLILVAGIEGLELGRGGKRVEAISPDQIGLDRCVFLWLTKQGHLCVRSPLASGGYELNLFALIKGNKIRVPVFEESAIIFKLRGLYGGGRGAHVRIVCRHPLGENGLSILDKQAHVDAILPKLFAQKK